MKKKIILMITLCSLLLSYGCGKSNDDAAPKEEAKKEITIDDQIDKFLATVDQWKVKNDDFKGKYGYAITDVDQDGKNLNEGIYDISIKVDDSTLDYSDIDDESKELYNAFMRGEVNATVMGTCPDTTRSEWFKDNFVKNNSYNIKQIIDKCSEAENMECTNEIEGKYIDCGLDGNYELLVGVRFHYGATSYLDLIIKNINGKLYICFVGDSWERKRLSLGENGFCGCLWNVDGSRHEGEEYYIDAEGKCNFYEFYGFDSIDELEEEYQESVLNEVNLNYISFSFARFSEKESAPLYAFGIDIQIDDEFIERTDETEDLFVAAEKILEEKGYKILSPEDEETFFKEMRNKIGFTEDIYNADVSYYEY